MATRVLENELHDFRKHLEIALLLTHRRVEDVTRKTNQFVNDFHDIFRVVSVFAVLETEAIPE